MHTRTSLLLTCALIASLSNSARQGGAVAAPQPSESISLSIELAPKSVQADSEVKVRVTVQNLSPNSVFVCRDFSNAPCDLQISIEPLAHASHSGLAKDCLPRSWSAPSQNPESLDTILRKSWIFLPSGAFYGVSMELSPRDYPELKIPGKYRIAARLLSSGFSVTDCYPAMESKAAELADLPATAWRGRADSNRLEFNVR
jgi:hypothetical protein